MLAPLIGLIMGKMVSPIEAINSIKVPPVPAPRHRASAVKMRILRESGASSNTPV